MTSPTTQAAKLPYRRILHPSDFTEDSHTGLIHAIKLAHAAQGELSVVHVDPNVSHADFEDFPKIRPILEQWGWLPPGSRREQVRELGMRINKIRTVAKNPTEGLLRHLVAHPADLLVMSTNQYDGLARWSQTRVAEPVARESHTPTLFVPAHVEGFVVKDSGQPKLRRVLVPVSANSQPQQAINAAVQLATALGCANLTGIVMHIGEDETLQSIHYPSQPGWLWHTMTCRGNIVDVILAMGKDFDVDLIVMTTSGHNSIFDRLRGSVTERVLRGARCPLLALPV